MSCWLDELGKNALEVGQAHEPRQFGGRRVGKHSAFGDDNDASANLLDDFEHMRDVEDGFSLGGEHLKKIFEEARGDDIEAGERLIEDEQPGIVQERRGNQHALAHALGV